MYPIRKSLSVPAPAVWYVFAALIILSIALALPACKKKEQLSRSSGLTAANADAFVAGYAPSVEKRKEVDDKPSPRERKVIVTHSMTVEVKDLSASFRAVIELAKTGNGYTTETGRVRNDDGSYEGRVVMRVPSGEVGNLLEKLRAFGTVVIENSTGEDITEQYVDMEARLKNARASEVRLHNLMSRQTQRLADVLAVEKELTRVRGDIEAFEAQKRSWDILTTLVTIQVTLVEPRGAFPVSYKVWGPLRTAFGEALESFAGSLHAMIVFAGMVLPWTLLLGSLGYWYLKSRSKARTV